MPQCTPRRAVRRHTRSCRSSWLRWSSSDKTAAAPAAAAAATAKPARGTAFFIGLTRLLGRSGSGRLALGLGLVLHAEAGRRHCLQPLLGDGLAVELARAVGAVVEAAKGVLDVA